MITAEVIVLLGLALTLGVGAVSLLAYGIYSAITDRDLEFCIGMVACFIFLSFLSGIMFVGAYTEYQNAIPQNQIKILRQKISDAEKEYQKYLIDHPELKELAELEQELR